MKRWRPSTRVILNAAAVRELLDQLDLSQNELARRCGITSGHLSHLMNGRRSPSPRSGGYRRSSGWTTFTGCSSTAAPGTTRRTPGRAPLSSHYTSGNDIIADHGAGEKIWVCIGNGSRGATIAQADRGSDRVIITITLARQANIEAAAVWSDPNAARALSETTEGRAPAVSADTGPSRDGSSDRGYRAT